MHEARPAPAGIVHVFPQYWYHGRPTQRSGVAQFGRAADC